MNMTIKRMLISLVLTGIIVTLALSLTSLKSNKELIESQKRLTELVIPLDTATHQVKAAVMAFTVRKYAVTDAKSLERLEQVADRKKLEEAFSKQITLFKQLVNTSQEMAANQKIKNLEKLYAEMLQKDAEILESVRKSLTFERDIKVQISLMDTTVAELHKYMEMISDKIQASFSEYIKPQKGDALKSISEFFMKDYTRIQKVSSDLKIAIFNLGDIGRQILFATELDQISNMQTEGIAKYVEHIEYAIENLKTISSDAIPIFETVQKIDRSYRTLKNILTDDERSISKLRNKWISEQQKIKSLNADLDQIADALTASLSDLQRLADEVRHAAEQNALQVNQMAIRIILIVGAIAILIMIVMGFLIVRRIIAPIQKVVLFADTISKGDLTAEIEPDHNDEIGTLVSKLSNMAHSLNSLIGQVQRSGIQVTSSATELSAVSKQQEAVMRTQLESTNHVVKSVEEISNVSAELVETMKRVAAMSDQTADFATKGQTDLAQMEEAMHHMENASKSISAKLEAINEKAANITSVVTTITKVADQTNLLSLNAAIEAEKAGEYGRGFTVVAREIRRLADQTAVATLDIEQMVQEMQSAVSAGVMEMDAFIAEVQKSAENVGKISTQLTRIIQQVQALSPSFEEVNESMQIQSGNAKQINESIANLSEEMQQTMESLQESFMAIEQLNDAARGLQDEVSRFKVM